MDRPSYKETQREREREKKVCGCQQCKKKNEGKVLIRVYGCLQQRIKWRKVLGQCWVTQKNWTRRRRGTNSIPTEIWIPAGIRRNQPELPRMAQNFSRGGTRRYLIWICLPVQYFQAIPARTEQNRIQDNGSMKMFKDCRKAFY